MAVYTQLVQFQSDLFSEEKVFVDPDSSLQRTIHELAHRLRLEFEFSLLTRSARVTRPVLANLYYATEDQVSPTFAINGPNTEDVINGLHDVTQTRKGSAAAEANVAERISLSTFTYPDSPPGQVGQESASIISVSDYSNYYGTIKTSPVPCLLADPISSTASTESIDFQSGVNNMSRKRSSSAVSTCSEYQEIVFDTRSGRSVCSTSAPSMRRGTMDSISREAMKAVKAVGACWRCKFLRKTVSALETRC
jgi:hypothetical protein